MSGQGPTRPQFGLTTASSRSRSASAPPTILPRNGLVFESIRNDLGQSVATGFRNVQGGTNENVMAASNALGNDAIVFQGSEHTVRAALDRAIELASVTSDAQIAGFLFVAKPSMMAKSPDELQELNLIRLRLPTDPATSSGPSVQRTNPIPTTTISLPPAFLNQVARNTVTRWPQVKEPEKPDENDED
ncbi:hypothetical protein CEP54_009266 [Fusarium duplospermum]|uniref:Uncharacterized protein n=1 Tax=Fusarium duplospermum TaxID=1325734 RepID=A0A428PS42_9HYPO|nr:hypothetical protein CEP54_009266 [Fusarium duplospermum]